MGSFSVNLEGKAAIVTGGGSGVGRAIAAALGAAGAAVCVNDINPDSTEAAAQAIQENGGKAFGWQADVSNRYQVGSLIEEARDRFGKIDILVNAAGVLKQGAMAKLDEWDWRRVLDVNLTGTFFMTQLMGRVMTDEGGGVIVNIMSDAVYEGGSISYTASKEGVLGMTRQAVKELSAANIRVNTVAYGAIDGDANRVPLGHAGSEQDVANGVLFLCSDAAGFINGHTLTINGGAYIR